MNDPWFDANVWGWLPGTLFGTLAGVWGGAAGALAPRGKAKRLMLGAGLLFLAAAASFLIAGLAALAAGQAYGVWYGLLLPGVLGLCLFPPLLPVVRKRCREAEERRIQAADFG